MVSPRPEADCISVWGIYSSQDLNRIEGTRSRPVADRYSGRPLSYNALQPGGLGMDHPQLAWHSQAIRRKMFRLKFRFRLLLLMESVLLGLTVVLSVSAVVVLAGKLVYCTGAAIIRHFDDRCGARGVRRPGLGIGAPGARSGACRLH